MTREEAIHILIDLINPNDDSEEAVEMAIKALEQEPYISLDDFRRYAIEHNYEIMSVELYKKAMSVLLQESYETSTNEPMTMVYPTIFCEDAISREAVLNRVARDYTEWDELYIDIAKLPSVTPSYKECRTLDEFIEEQKRAETKGEE